MQRELLSVCPTGFSTYVTLHLDSVGKIINHLLAIMLVCDVFLFFSSWSVSLLPNIGINTVLVSFLLCAQTVCVWLILNNNRISALSFLAPTEHMVGFALGITVGAAVLSLILSNAYRHVMQCGKQPPGGTNTVPSQSTLQQNQTSTANYSKDPAYELICHDHPGAMGAVWFWSGLVFWFNFCTCLLLAVGRQELSQESQYEHIGGDFTSSTVQDFEEQFRRAQAGLPAGDMLAQTPTPSFAGNYATIPEIRTDNGNASNSSSQLGSNAHIQSV